MDCARLRTLMIAGGTPPLPEVEQHLGECPACRALFSDDGQLARLLSEVQPAPIPAPSFDEVAARIAGESHRWTRLAELPSKLRWGAALAVLMVPPMVGLILRRHNLDAYPAGRLVIELLALAGLALASCWMWLRPLYKRQPSRALRRVLLASALALPWVLSLLPAALPSAVPALDGSAARQLRHALSCFLFGSLTALPALLVVFGLGRRSGGLSGFVLLPAVAAALAGVLGLELHCPEASPSHLAAGHATIALAFPLILALAQLRRAGGRIPPR